MLRLSITGGDNSMPDFPLWVLSLFGYLCSCMAAYHRDRKGAIVSALVWLAFPLTILIDIWASDFTDDVLEFLPAISAGLFFGIVLFPGMVLSETPYRKTEKQREEAADCMRVPLSLGIVVLFLCGYTLWNADKLGVVV